MRNNLGDRQRLLHISDSIEEIQRYIDGVGIDIFLENSMMKFATVKQIEIIGEAANHISEEVKIKFSNIQWKQITGLRHVLVHEYFGIDSRLIWQIIKDDLPDLKIAINKILSSLDNN